MRNFLQGFFSFNSRERKGTLALLFIILVLISIRVSNVFVYKYSSYDHAEFAKEIQEFEDQINIQSQDHKVAEEKDIADVIYFEFDPNFATRNEWLKLGLSGKQINVIENYKKTGGKFFQKEDLKKVYSISSKKYMQLEPYINIQISKEITPKKLIKPEKQIIKIDINTADSLALITLEDIGPVFSSRIIKYRELLGGYISISQLNEVYGLNIKVIEKNQQRILIDTLKIEKLNINTAGFKDLIKHPYFDRFTTNSILKYRETVEIISQVDELIENDVLTKENYNRIYPYLVAK